MFSLNDRSNSSKIKRENLMSSILTDSTEPLFEVQDENGGLRIIGQDDQANLFIVGESGFNDPPLGGSDTIIGGSQADVIEGGLLDDIIIGGAGDDILSGDEGSDIIIGGAGSDVIRGGTGVDDLTGGDGEDIFEFFSDDLFRGEIDKITDFTQEPDGSIEDVIILRGIGEDADVSYDSTTGRVSVNGQEVIQLDKNLDINILNSEGDEDYELF